MNLKVKRELVLKAKDELNLLDEEKLKIQQLLKSSIEDYIEINSASISAPLLSFFLKNSNGMANKTKALLSMELFGESSIITDNINDVWETKIKKLADIVECFSRIGTKKPNADIFFNKTWYPVIIVPKFNPASRYAPAYINVVININFANEYIDIGFNIMKEDLLSIYGDIRNITLKELFSEFGCRPQQFELKEFNQLVMYSKSIKNQNIQMTCNGYALILEKNEYNRTGVFVSIKLGNEKFGERIIIEADLEYGDQSARSKDINKENYWTLPIIRAFSFLLKKYIFVSVKDIKDYVFDEEAVNRIFLPKKITHLLNKIFQTPINQFSGDILDNKHGGMIILAAGNPGVGKTSTAEVYSEMQKIPLYTMDISELGTHVEQIEKNLALIFKRVEKWNAIILFDEIDIFLAKRDKNDLNRTAIVGVFLRLMDYFRGIMFLTSNLPQVLDYAISSRVTLRIDYPDLDEKTREIVWKDKLEKANIKLVNGYSKLAKLNFNGREIRNIARLAKIILPENNSEDELIKMIETTYSNSEKILEAEFF